MALWCRDEQSVLQQQQQFQTRKLYKYSLIQDMPKVWGDHTWGLDSSTGCATGDVMCDIIGEFLDIVNVTVSAESFQ